MQGKAELTNHTGEMLGPVTVTGTSTLPVFVLSGFPELADLRLR